MLGLFCFRIGGFTKFYKNFTKNPVTFRTVIRLLSIGIRQSASHHHPPPKGRYPLGRPFLLIAHQVKVIIFAYDDSSD